MSPSSPALRGLASAALESSTAKAGQARGAAEIARAVRRGELSPVQLCEDALAQEDLEGAWCYRDAGLARAAAQDLTERLERARAAGRALGALAGVPLGLKDLFITRDLPTTAGSAMLEGWRPPYQGTQAERLVREGALLMGKQSLDEFGMGGSGEWSPGGAIRNPWKRERVAGGSSGGSAAALAQGSCALSLGSDTGGSVRQPASFCGVAGLKPSWGRISRHGMIAFASSLDQPGPLARRVEDLALALAVLAGRDPCDATSSDKAPPRFGADDLESLPEHLPGALGWGDLKGRRIGWHPGDLEHDALDPGVRASFEQDLDRLREMGAELVEFDLPHARFSVPTYYVLCTAEAASNLARYDGLRFPSGRGTKTPPREPAQELEARYREARDRLGPEVRRRILLGTFVLRADSWEAYYGRALAAREAITRDWEEVWGKCELAVRPTAPTPAFAPGRAAEDPLALYLADLFTVDANLTRGPAMSLPTGSAQGLPVGLQILAPPFEEERLLHGARTLEARLDAQERAS